MRVTTIRLDLAKSVFRAHGIDETGRPFLAKRLQRKQRVPYFLRLPRSLIGAEACAIAHHRARTLTGLSTNCA